MQFQWALVQNAFIDTNRFSAGVHKIEIDAEQQNYK